jgi:hypothetical protein
MPRFAASALLAPSPPADDPSEKTPRRRRPAADAGVRPSSNTLNDLVFPAWARLSEKPASDGERDAQHAAEAFFAAGAGLALLDRIFRENPPYAGALRQRLALRATATAAKILRLREDEGGLRDAEHLSLANADPGRAGRLHRLWRALAAGQSRLDGEIFARVLPLLDAPPTIKAENLDAAVRNAVAQVRHPLVVSARTATLVANALPPEMHLEAEILAFWAADWALAKTLGWERPTPLLATRILDPSLRRGATGRRPRACDPHWPETMARAYALAAIDAHALAADLARRCEKLLAAAPKLRAKGAARVIELLLADDAATPARAAQTTGCSDRAARRLFDRLVALGAVRELSGRTNFRLYGL